MKTLTHHDFEEIRIWMHRNARPLELAVWNYEYEGGKKDEIIKALAYYQNEDGGFGNGVEPDCWDKESSPYATMTVIGLLRKIGFAEEAGPDHEMIAGILRYLGSGVNSDDEGWHFTIPSSDGYPRAPWHTYDEEVNRMEDMGVTAFLSAFVLRYGRKDTKLYKKAAMYAQRIFQKALDRETFGEMGIGGISVLTEDVMVCGLEPAAACAKLGEKLKAAANCVMERNPEKWAFYTPRPSEFILSPLSPLYKENEEIMETELDYLIDTRNPGGVWNITWSWFDLGEIYPKEFAVSEVWWMAYKTIEKVSVLKRFGRITQ